MKDFLKHFWIDLAITFLALAFVFFFYGGLTAFSVTAMLILLEIVFSFDNAGVNAKYLAKMSHFWRRIFLTVGVLIAVFGMRLVFPFLIVSLAGGIGIPETIRLAAAQGDPHTPGTYGYILEQAHPTIVAFGSSFLLMLFFSWLVEDKEHHWLHWIEKPMSRAGAFESLPVLFTGIFVLVGGLLLTDPAHSQSVLTAGLAGIITFLATNGLSSYMEARNEEKESELASLGDTVLLTGKAAFSMFMFLEVLDASFSFDGVLGAFAITTDPIIIAIGLGVGALYVRSMTIYLVEKETLQEFRFMDNGAHWAIGVLASLLFLTLKFDISDVVIGLAGIVFITASIISSHKANKAEASLNA